MMTPIPEEGAPPAADIEVPTANPLQPNAETTYVSLVHPGRREQRLLHPQRL